MKEEWKPIPGYEGYYEVSNHGRVRGLKRGRVLKSRVNHGGYHLVQLHKEGKKKHKRIHRLMLEAFVGPCPEGMECLHIDGDPANNRLDNLRWASPSDNNLDTVKHGRHNNANKTHCPRGHELTPENIPNWIKKVGRRQCLACYRGYDYIRGHPELADRIQDLADQYYAKIMAEATDAPVIVRSRDARGIMDRHRAEQNKERNEQQ